MNQAGSSATLAVARFAERAIGMGLCGVGRLHFSGGSVGYLGKIGRRWWVVEGLERPPSPERQRLEYSDVGIRSEGVE